MNTFEEKFYKNPPYYLIITIDNWFSSDKVDKDFIFFVTGCYDTFHASEYTPKINCNY